MEGEYDPQVDKLKVVLPFTCRFAVIIPSYALVTAAAYYFEFVGDQWQWAAFVGGIAISVGAIGLGLIFDGSRALRRIPGMQALFNGVPATLILLLLVALYFACLVTICYSGLVGDAWWSNGTAAGLMLFLGAVIFGPIADGARALWFRT